MLESAVNVNFWFQLSIAVLIAGVLLLIREFWMRFKWWRHTRRCKAAYKDIITDMNAIEDVRSNVDDWQIKEVGKKDEDTKVVTVSKPTVVRGGRAKAKLVKKDE